MTSLWPSTPADEDFPALLDREYALSAGYDLVTIIPDVGSVGAGHTENLCLFLLP